MKRGAFSQQEENLIIELHAVLGNRYYFNILSATTSYEKNPTLDMILVAFPVVYSEVVNFLLFHPSDGRRLQLNYQEGRIMK